jgi:hypothetical protein
MKKNSYGIKFHHKQGVNSTWSLSFFESLKRFASCILYLCSFLLFFSCRKDIKVQLPDYTQKLVVEASIETNQPAIVLLSYSVPFFGNFDFTHPEKAFVKGAFITVSDGTITDTIKEIAPNIGYFYFGSKVKGQVGKSYHLTISVGGKNYSCDTYLNPQVKLDSIYFKGEKDTLGFISAHMHEPAGLGNAYRWFAKRLHKDSAYAAPSNSVFDDKFVDGKDFSFSYERGVQPNQTQSNDKDPEAGYYRVGDTVVVKFCTIGRKEYLFWDSYYKNAASNGNPFSSPSNIQSFINGDAALGGFFGYSTSFDTLVIKKK